MLARAVTTVSNKGTRLTCSLLYRSSRQITAAQCLLPRSSRNYAASSTSTSTSSSSPSTPEIRKVGVVGLGLMGHGIAQQTAMKGFDVVAVDVDDKVKEKGMSAIDKSLSKLASKGTITEEDAKTSMARVKGSTKTSDLGDCDLVIEAIVENMDIKNKFYSQLGKECKQETIFATNTSSFPVHKLAAASGREDRFCGLHFFNPVQIMKLVEVIRTDKTAPEVFDAAHNFVKKIEKVPVKTLDTPGFIVNRLLVPYLAQAMLMYDRGVADKKDIDTGMKLGAGHPMGPLELADYVGLDTVHNILIPWHKEYPNEGAFVVPDCLEKLVKEDKLGRKSGQGFYKWDGNKVAE